MPEPYTPPGTDMEFTVPVFPETLNGPEAFKAFARSVAAIMMDGIPIVGEAATFDVGADHLNSWVTCTHASVDIEVNLLANPGTGFPVGGCVIIARGGAADVTFVQGAGATVRGVPGLALFEEESVAFAVRVGSSTWWVSGDLT